ncbi:hypothetical protein DFQ07_2765 [Tenacibaculum caenipelagi]|uniref:Uncharacterized protein n=2 Tax=Tenacibaculum caenipelagi TaxID=1325435 RepID=A0A4R6TCT3_9FLAO|nr:hypothetical protein DFQ07_2765 [Tenacibaculum caenipelagi]
MLGVGGGSGWLGWFFARKSRKVDYESKVFQLKEEMLEAIKKDFGSRLDFLQEEAKEHRAYIKYLKLELSIYRKKYGILDDNEISNFNN